MRKFTKITIAALGAISLLGCQQQEDVVEISNEIKTESFYNLLEEGMNTVFNNTYKDITINTSFSDMSNMIETNCQIFLTEKGLTATHDDIIQSRNVNMSQLGCNNNLKESHQAVVDEVLEIMQSPDYNNVRLRISQLHSQILNITQPNERIELLQYLDFIENMLDFIETEKGKFDVLNTFIRYNEFHEFEISEAKFHDIPATRANIPDGKYPYPEKDDRYILITGNQYYIINCPNGLFYANTCQCCDWDKEASTGSNWWNAWGKCLAAIIGGGGTGGLAGGLTGSTFPIIGTAVGAIAGTIFGGLLAASTGC